MTEQLTPAETADLHALLRDWLRRRPAVTSLAAADQLATEIGRAAAACAFTEGAAACGTRAGYQGGQRPCPCGQRARFVDYRRRWVRGLHGEAAVSRAYYRCRACGAGQIPWDREQGLDAHLFTPALKARVTELCARLPYREAREVLARCCGLDLAESTLEAVTLQVGAALRRTEDTQVQALFERDRLPSAEPHLATLIGRRCYLSLDAAKAHTGGAWHDIKVAVCYRGEAGTAEGTGDRAGPPRYLATQETAEAFGRRLYTWALRQGWERAAEGVVLGDGAEWIWVLAERHFSDATFILDFFHACEHLWELARTVFGPESPEGAAWARQAGRALEAEGPAGLLRSLRRLRKGGEPSAPERTPLSPEARRAVAREIGYFRRNRRRMRYPEYRAAGMQIGSGPVEAACKVVVGARLKRAGMRWSEAGADAVLAARTAVLAGEYAEIARHALAA